MLSSIKNILTIASTNLKKVVKTNPAFIATEHFQERVIQRFENEDLPLLEKTIEKAFLKADAGVKTRYTHPAYNVTVVGKKIGINGFELITCWIKDEDKE